MFCNLIDGGAEISWAYRRLTFRRKRGPRPHVWVKNNSRSLPRKLPKYEKFWILRYQHVLFSRCCGRRTKSTRTNRYPKTRLRRFQSALGTIRRLRILRCQASKESSHGVGRGWLSDKCTDIPGESMEWVRRETKDARDCGASFGARKTNTPSNVGHNRKNGSRAAATIEAWCPTMSLTTRECIKESIAAAQ